jgi:hypothetical protein
LTKALPSEGLLSQKTWMVAIVDIPTPLSDENTQTGHLAPKLFAGVSQHTATTPKEAA